MHPAAAVPRHVPAIVPDWRRLLGAALARLRAAPGAHLLGRYHASHPDILRNAWAPSRNRRRQAQFDGPSELHDARKQLIRLYQP